MTATTVKFPITLKERGELGSDPYPFEASMEEFGDLLEVCEYQIEFQNGTIIAMSMASDSHEQLVANLLGVLFLLFKGNSNFKRYGSNRHVFIGEAKVVFSPDASVIKGEPEVVEYAKGKTANKNPWLLAEILSPSTRNRDWGEKLTLYKNIPSLKYLLYIEQDISLVTVFERRDEDGRWSSIDYNTLDQSFTIEGQAVSLADLYENILTT
jgi:Uma2 family endonuclease